MVRKIWSDEDIYEGEFNMDKLHGKGKHEVYESGIRIVEHWINDKPEGEFKCYDKQGNMTIMHFKDGEIV